MSSTLDDDAICAPVFSNSEKLKAVRRELQYRRFVYPKRVASGQMMPEQAKREIAVMEAIVAEYEKLAAEERLL